MDTGQQHRQSPRHPPNYLRQSSPSQSHKNVICYLTSGYSRRAISVCSVVFLVLLSANSISGQTISSNAITGTLFREGQNITLNCSSNIPVTLSWNWTYSLKNPIITNSTTVGSPTGYWSVLTYNATALDNNRVITCSSFDGANTNRATISPSIILVPNTPVIEGPANVTSLTPRTWTCYSQGASYVPPNVYWRNGSGAALLDGVTKDTSIAQIPNENFVFNVRSTITKQLPATRVYELQCYVIHVTSSYSDEKLSIKNITVLFPPQISTGGHPNITSNEMGTVIFPCSVNANPDASKIIWLKDGLPIDMNSTRYSGGNVSDPNLTIRNVSRSDAGNYTCTAINDLGNGSAPDTPLIIQYAPVIIYNVTTFTGNASVNLTIPCPVKAVPDVNQIIWKRVINSVHQTIDVTNGSKFSGGNAGTKQYDLTISNLQPEDIGTYYCTAKNPIGERNGSNLFVVVIFAVKPIIQVPPTSVVAIESQQFNLTCGVSPLETLIEFYWTKNGSPVNTTDAARYAGGTLSRPSLTVLSANSADVGVYTCVASNLYGTTQSPGITVTLNGKPHVTVPNLIINATSNTGLILLDCEVTANPALNNFYWAKDGQRLDISDTNKYLGGTLGARVLIIYTPVVSDSGNYTCVASNSVGTTNSSAIIVTVSSIPQVTVTLSNSTVLEGTPQLTITCSVSANPKESAVFWMKGGYLLPLKPDKYSGGNLSVPSLTVYNLDSGDTGSYVCVANNTFGSASSPSVSLNVIYAPHLYVSNTTYFTPVGSTVQLTCGMDANPSITSFYWLKNGMNVISSALNATKYSGGTVGSWTLTIYSSAIQDNGNYSCVAGNSVGTRTSSNVLLIVTSLPEVTITPSLAITTEGAGQFIFNCSIVASPPAQSVSWRKDGLAVNTTGQSNKYSVSSIDNPSLTILSVQKSDAGPYSCEATNSVGTKQSSQIQLTVQYIPVIVVGSSTITVNAGTTFTLTCSVDANPVASSLNWTKSGAIIGPGTNSLKYSGGTVTTPSLTVVDAAASDAGEYVCNAGNTIGSNSSRSVTVLVSDVPGVSVSQTNLTFIQGTPSALIPCNVTGYPAATNVSWEKDGKSLNMSSQMTKYSGASLSNPSLTFANVARDDAGIYYCSAINGVGTKRSSPITVLILYPPLLTVNANNVAKILGASVTLACLVSANPWITSFQWLKDGQPLVTTNNLKYSGGNLLNTNLTINDLDPGNDTGTYTCKAENAVGTQISEPIKLLITTIPVIDSNQTQVNTSENRRVTLRCPAVPLDSLLELHWTKNGEMVITVNSSKYEGGNVTTPDLTINNLTVDDSGIYLCYATNKYGTTTGGNTTISLSYAPILTVSNTSITNNAGETIILTCSVSSNPAISNFYWTKSDTVVNTAANPAKYSGGTMTSTTLSILNASSSDIANYSCVAGNALGTTKSNPVSVNVITVPVINTTTPNISASSNTTVILHCPVTPLNSLSDLYWTKDGQRLNSTNSFKYSGGNKTVPSLTIYLTSAEDIGTYVCVASNQFGNSSGGNTTLNITYAPILTVSNTSITSNAGETIILTCIVSSNPAITNFYWTKSDTVVNTAANPAKYSGGTMTSTTLSILNASSSDIANYSCVAVNSFGTTKSNPVSVNVITVPVINTTTPNITASSNTTVTLQCPVTPLNSLSDLYWTKDGQRLSSTNSFKYSGGNKTVPSLTIYLTTAEDIGTYVCVASNQFGNSSGGNTTLNITYSPVLTVSNTIITNNAGETIILTCTVSSNPAITNFYWTKSDTVVNTAANPAKYSGGTMTSTTLSILNASSSDIANYSCVAVNSFGTTKSNPVSVNVITVPVINTTTPNITASSNTTVTLQCPVTPLNSLSDLYWTKDGQRLSSTNSFKYSGGNETVPSLTIYLTSAEDIGTYVCVASNQFGNSSGGNTTLNITYSPVLTVSNTSITNNAGETIILTCTVSSNPAITNFYWTKSDTVVNTAANPAKYSGGTMTSTTLSILNASSSDIANYSCVAVNSFGTTKSNPVSVNVITVPVINTTTPNITASSNTNVTLQCPVTPLNSLSDLYWTKDGQRLSSTNSFKYSGGNKTVPSLTIYLTSAEDIGTYVCVASNQFGNSSGGNTTLNITYSPVLTVSNTSITNNAGETIILTCTVSSNPAITNFYWTKSDTVVNTAANPAKYSGGTMTSTTLSILNASSSDIANYSCVAVNSFGTTKSNPVSVNVITVPVINTTTPNITASSNTTVTLQCPVTPLNSLSDLYWTKDGQRLSSTNSFKYSGGNKTVPSLTIYLTSAEDIGTYVCVASNQFGNSSGGNTTLNITYSPVLTVSNTSITNNAGETIILTCTVSSNPAITNFYWTKSDTVVNTAANPAKYSGGTMTSTTLSILNASSSDIANYSCVAVNSFGTTKSNPVSVNVITVPVINTTTPNITASSNTTVTLQCPVTPLNSLSDLYWTKDGQRLSSTNSFKYSGGNKTVPSLTIYLTSAEDIGTYVCVASNQFGNSSGGNTTLNITYSPVLTVSNTSITNNAGETIILTCTVSSNPAITNFYWTKSDTVVNTAANPAKYSGGTMTSTTLSILNASSSDIANYSCVAVNSFGTTKSNPVSVNVITVPVIDITTPNITASSNTTVTLQCPVTPLNSLSDLYWTKDGQRLSSTNSFKYSGGNKTVPSLTIYLTSAEDIGTYVCVASNQFGNSSGGNTTLNITYSPVLTVSNTSIINNAGETIILTCTVSSNPAITNFYWTKSDTVVNTAANPAKYSGGTMTSTTLSILNASSSDIANYSCVAVNSFGTTKSNPVSVNVITVPVIDITTPNITASSNTTVTLQCPVTPLNSLSDLYWTMNGQRLSSTNSFKYSGGNKSVPSLTIYLTSAEDIGTYVCVASNQFGNSSGGNTTLNITYPPVIQTDASNIIVASGSNLTLTCIVSANPPVTNFYWMKNSVRIYPSLNTAKYSGGNLTLTNLSFLNVNTEVDSGLYSCVAENSIGATNSQIYNVTIANWEKDLAPNALAVSTKPIIIQPNNTTVPGTENTTVTLECQVSPLTPLTDLYWTKDGARLNTSNPVKYSGGTKDSPNLTIKSLTETDIGKYECMAVNGNGQTGGPNITVNVDYKPRLTVNNSSINVTFGNPVSLECTVSANPNISSFYWSKIGSGVINTSSNSSKYGGGTVSNTTLVIYITDVQDSGAYTCTAGNTLGNTTSTAVTLNIITTPIIIQPNNTTVPGTENTTVTLECQVSPLTPLTNLYWTKDGARLNTSNPVKYSGGTKDSPNLTIKSLTETDIGKYECMAVNGNGQTGGLNITVNVDYKPRLTVNNSSINVTFGNPVSLMCTVSANPNISSFYWSKVGSGVINTSSNSSKYGGGTVSNTTLVIYITQVQDSGVYTCTAGNTLGNTTSTAVTLNIISRLSVTAAPPAQTVPEGQSEVTFNCTIQAVPAVQSVYWLKDGQVVNATVSPLHYIGGTLTRPDLSILNVTRSDAGIYVCYARNDVWNGTSANISLSVTYLPKINTSTETSRGSVGQNVTLSCDYAAFPPITQLYWLKDGAVINTTQNPSKYSGGTVGVPALTIINLNITSDTGSYRCMVNNSVGSGEGPRVNLTVVFDPYITVLNNDTLTVRKGENFSMNVEVHMYPPSNSLIWYKENSTIDISNQTKYQNGTLTNPSLTVLSAVPQDSGTYTIIASNSNSTVNRTINIIVLYAPEVTAEANPIKIFLNEAFELVCSANSYPADVMYRWYNGTAVISNTKTYTHYNASIYDYTQYRCSVNNSVGTGRAVVTPNIWFRPVKLGTGLDIYLLPIPSSVTLDCQVLANPEPSVYRWFNGSNEIPGATAYNLTLVLDSAEDFTDYTCSANNSMGGLDPARTFSIQLDTPKTGGSTQSSELSTATIILIVIICVILLVILILLLIFCILQGAFKKCSKSKKVEPTNIDEPSQQSTTNLIAASLSSAKPIVPLAAGTPGLIISIPEKIGPKPHTLPPLDPQAEAATEKFYRQQKQKRRSRKKKPKVSKEDEKILTENGSDEGKTSPPPPPPPLTPRIDGATANSSMA